MSRTTRWWWVRHAPVINTGGGIYGRKDVEADTSDAEAYDALSRLLPEDAVWMHTGLMRTRQTGEAVLAARRRANSAFISPSFAIEEDFQEQSFGDWVGRDREEVRAELGRPQPMWLTPAHFRPPGGESFLDLMARVGHGIERQNNRHPGKDIISFAHGGTIRAVLAYVMGIAPETALGFQVDNLSITEVSFFPAEGAHSHWTVGSVNLPPVHGLRFGLPQA
jgi:alpha-ribazole phosphatase